MAITITGLRYSKADNSTIDMTVNGWIEEPIPFTYNANDPAPLTQMVKGLLAKGEYSIAPYTPQV